MTVTIPLRLTATIVEDVDAVREARGGVPSRNAILREAIVMGLRQLGGKK